MRHLAKSHKHVPLWREPRHELWLLFSAIVNVSPISCGTACCKLFRHLILSGKQEIEATKRILGCCSGSGGGQALSTKLPNKQMDRTTGRHDRPPDQPTTGPPVQPPRSPSHLWPFCVNFWVHFSTQPKQKAGQLGTLRSALPRYCPFAAPLTPPAYLVLASKRCHQWCSGDICMNIKSSCTAICDFASDIKRGQRGPPKARGRHWAPRTSSFRAGASKPTVTQINAHTQTARLRYKHTHTHTQIDEEQRQHVAHFIWSQVKDNGRGATKNDVLTAALKT